MNARRLSKALMVVTMVVLVSTGALFVWTMFDIRNILEEAARERNAGIERIIRSFADSQRDQLADIAKNARAERQNLRRDHREIIRQLGGDPSRIPPPQPEPSGANNPEPREREPKPEPEPDPSPTTNPEPSPTPRDCFIEIDDVACVDRP